MDVITQAEIARKVGVSQMAVSMAFSNRGEIAIPTRDRILRAARELGYHPDVNLAARRLAARRRGGPPTVKIMGLTTDWSGGPIYKDSFSNVFLHGLMQGCWEQGLTLALINLDLSRDDWIGALANIDGLVMPGSGPSPVLRTAKRLGKPIVGVFTDEPDVFSIGIDERAAVGLAFEHLWSRGHREIGYLGLVSLVGTAPRRHEAYRDCLAGVGRAYDEAQTVSLPVQSGPHSFGDVGAQAMRELWSRPRRPSAVIVYNDAMALGVLQAARELGVSVPDQLSVIAIDDIPEAAAANPSLTTVSIDIAGMGREAILSLGEFARTETYRTGKINSRLQLMIRNSVANVGHT